MINAVVTSSTDSVLTIMIIVHGCCQMVHLWCGISHTHLWYPATVVVPSIKQGCSQKSVLNTQCSSRYARTKFKQGVRESKQRANHHQAILALRCWPQLYRTQAGVCIMQTAVRRHTLPWTQLTCHEPTRMQTTVSLSVVVQEHQEYHLMSSAKYSSKG